MSWAPFQVFSLLSLLEQNWPRPVMKTHCSIVQERALMASWLWHNSNLMEVERGMEGSEEGEREAALQMTLEQWEWCLMFSSYRLSDTNVLSGLNRIGPLLSTAIHHLWSELVASDKTTNCTWYQKRQRRDDDVKLTKEQTDTKGHTKIGRKVLSL